MTLAGLLNEIRLRAESYGQDIRAESAEAVLTTLVGMGSLPTPEGQVIRKVLGALALSHTDPEFSDDELAELTPLTLVALCRLTEGMLEGDIPATKLRAMLRPLLVRVLNSAPN